MSESPLHTCFAKGFIYVRRPESFKFFCQIIQPGNDVLDKRTVSHYMMQNSGCIQSG